MLSNSHLVTLLLLTATQVSAETQFPNIDLGYAVHAPTYINSTTSGLQIANYQNIRYAQPPIGDFRFCNARTPPPHHDGVLNGTEYAVTDCVNSVPAVAPFPGLNGTHGGTEDCLFLNVMVPEGVKEGDDVPVLHWIHGSAYAFGSKDNNYINAPYIGLFNRIRDPEEKYIFVASNYRLGLYGWMASPYEDDMDANIGVHDAKAAIEWTRRYISRFGGDRDRITAIGSSSGAAILNVMLTGDGGAGDVPFSQAILSSPALMPRRNATTRRQEVYESVLNAVNCKSLACLRDVSPSTLSDANDYLISGIPAGTGGTAFGPGIGFSPVVDGTYVPDSPMVLLSQGRFHRSVERVMAANMANEGMGTAADSNMPAAFPDLVRKVFPTASDDTVRSIRDLFPYPSDTPQRLAWDWLTSVAFACHARAVAGAYGDRARRYVMSIPPAIHGQDLFYIFYDSNDTTPVNNVSTAHTLQSYTLDFIHGKDLSENDKGSQGSSQNWPAYGQAATIMNITESGFQVQTDPWETSGVCDELMKDVLDPANGA